MEKLIFNLYNSKVVINEKEIEEQIKQIKVELKLMNIIFQKFQYLLKMTKKKNIKIFSNKSIKKNGFEKTAIKLSISPTSSQGEVLVGSIQNLFQKNYLEF